MASGSNPPGVWQSAADVRRSGGLDVKQRGPRPPDRKAMSWFTPEPFRRRTTETTTTLLHDNRSGDEEDASDHPHTESAVKVQSTFRGHRARAVVRHWSFVDSITSQIKQCFQEKEKPEGDKPACSSGNAVIVLYSAAFLYLQGIAALQAAAEPDCTLAAALRGVLLTKPVDDGRSESYHSVRDILETVIEKHDVSGPVPPHADGKWLGVSPGMRGLSALVRSLASITEADDSYSLVAIREYTDNNGVQRKISWAHGLATEASADFVVDIGGAGNIKLLCGETGFSVADASDCDISGDGSALLEKVHALLKQHSIELSRIALGMTGRWREGPRRHANAEIVLRTLQTRGNFISANLVSEASELRWEHTSAKQAALQLLPGLAQTDAPCHFLTVGSGSSTTQIAKSTEGLGGTDNLFKGTTLDNGLHIKPPCQGYAGTATEEQKRAFVLEA